MAACVRMCAHARARACVCARVPLSPGAWPSLDVVPNLWGRGGSRGWPGAPTWTSAYAVIPAVALEYGADVELTKQRYHGVRAHVDFLSRQAAPSYGAGTVQFGLMGDWNARQPLCPGSSDGCLAEGWTRGDATSAFYFVRDLEAMVEMASGGARGRRAPMLHLGMLRCNAHTLPLSSAPLLPLPGQRDRPCG